MLLRCVGGACVLGGWKLCVGQILFVQLVGAYGLLYNSPKTHFDVLLFGDVFGRFRIDVGCIVGRFVGRCLRHVWEVCVGMLRGA